jgi:hypothetical protein
MDELRRTYWAADFIHSLFYKARKKLVLSGAWDGYQPRKGEPRIGVSKACSTTHNFRPSQSSSQSGTALASRESTYSRAEASISEFAHCNFSVFGSSSNGERTSSERCPPVDHQTQRPSDTAKDSFQFVESIDLADDINMQLAMDHFPMGVHLNHNLFAGVNSQLPLVSSRL